MADSTLSDIRRTLADIAENVLRLPEQRPAQLPPVVGEVIGDLMQACDSLIAGLLGYGQEDPEAAVLLTAARAHRRLLFLVLAAIVPDQAEERTEAAYFQARVADARKAAGLIPRFYSDETFAETLREQWLGKSST